MPSTRNISKDATSSTDLSSAQHAFRFPRDQHLLITTPRHVFAWDAAGVQTIFSSSRAGIVAAKEAGDGSGVLAIASSNVVVMHDTKRGKEESWGLNAPQDEVRHLEYTPDAKTLYLTTTSDGTIQQYSTVNLRLLPPVQKHEDAPVALAVSSTGHLLLSASHKPPVVHLKNTTQNTPPIQLHPNASAAPVCCAAFHPERPNIFLLVFRDGIVAVYDATTLSKQSADTYSTYQGTKNGEVAHFQATHHAVMVGDDGFRASAIAPPIAAAAFLPGFKARVVTAGRDGRCKLFDLSQSVEVLRTWHAKAPLTSLSVLAMKPDVDSRPRHKSVIRDQRKRSSGSHTIGGPTTTNSIVAVSRIDGKIHLYDGVGLLVAQTTVSSQEEKILSLEWVKGLSPSPCNKNGPSRRFSDEVTMSLSRTIPDPPDSSQSPATGNFETAPDSFARSSGAFMASSSGCPPTHSSRKFTLHPDEVQEGTVRVTPSPKKLQLGFPAAAAYDDLFSPMKPAAHDSLRLSSPPRSRPRISSQTFLQTGADKRQSGLTASDQRLSRISPAKASQANTVNTLPTGESGQQSHLGVLRPVRRANTQISPTSKSRRRISFAHDGSNRITKSTRETTVNSNAQVLADIRKLSDHRLKKGTLSSYAASQKHWKIIEHPAEDNHSQAKRMACEVDVANSMTWPTDSASLSGEVSNNDIWLTSDSEEDDFSQPRRRRMQPLARPPARQTSRSKMDSQGTLSTAPDARKRPEVVVVQHNTDGSTDEHMFSATSHPSPNGRFSPASEHVREMFPRSSSLSPGKRRSTKKVRRVSPAKRYAALSTMPANIAMDRRPQSPWDRLKANKRSSPMKVFEDVPAVSGARPNSSATACGSCLETRARVKGLETEVAHLKGEVLALKAILRRNGLPFPACLR